MNPRKLELVSQPQGTLTPWIAVFYGLREASVGRLIGFHFDLIFSAKAQNKTNLFCYL